MKTNKFKYQDEWDTWVGKTVIKHSKKPFKSGSIIETPSDIIINPHSKKLGFKFSDENIVDCHQCRLLVDGEITNVDWLPKKESIS